MEIALFGEFRMMMELIFFPLCCDGTIEEVLYNGPVCQKGKQESAFNYKLTPRH